jgi:hypothetical protein
MNTIARAGLVALLALAACSQPKKAEGPKAPQVMDDTFRACKYMEVKGETLAMNAYACGPDFGNVHLVADETLPGFALVEGSGPDAMTYRPVVRIFTKPKDGGIDVILPEIRKLSPGPSTATCTLQPYPDPLDPDHSTRKLFALTPSGAAKAAWDKAVAVEPQDVMPCGPLGVGTAGDRLFEVMADDPTKVSYIDYGSEIQPFDAKSLRVLK